MTSIFQGLSLSRSIGRVGENPAKEVARVVMGGGDVNGLQKRIYIIL